MRRLAVLVALVLVLGGCRVSGTPAIGGLREIAVVTGWWGAVEPEVRAILQREMLTPQPEPEFTLHVFSPDQFRGYSMFRTLLVIGTTQDTLVAALLGARADSLPGGEYGLFRVPNPWAQNQELVIFAVRTDSLLVPGLRAYTARLRATFREIAVRHVERAVYMRGRDAAAERALARAHSFTIQVPKDWFLKQEHSAERFVYLFGHYPDRGVFVHWEDAPRALAADSLVALRDRLTAAFYRGDVVEPGYTAADTAEFLSAPAVRLQGIWQNEKETTGGPFVSYSFNHEGRFFMVDGYVYNPGKKKLGALLEVEAVIRTFTPQ